MKSLLITQNTDVVTGLRLAGIEGVYCRDKDQLKSEFDKAKINEDLGIIILTEEDFNLIKEEVFEIKLTKKLPLVVTIPSQKGLKEKDFLMKYIKDSIGVKIN